MQQQQQQEQQQQQQEQQQQEQSSSPAPLPDTCNYQVDPDGTIQLHPVDEEHPPACKHCGHSGLIRYGFQIYNGTRRQRYQCRLCRRVFIYRAGMEHMHYDIGTVSDVMDHYFKGHSCTDIADTLGRDGIKIHHTTVFRMVKRFVPIIGGLTSAMPICSVGDRFHADELFTRIGGEMHYIFGMTDHATRFLLAWDVSETKDGYDAARLLESAGIRAGKIPQELVTDALSSYHAAYERLYAPRNPLDVQCVHVADAGLGKPDKKNNNIQERFNSTQRRCYNARRGIKKKDSPIFQGFEIWYNFVRPHDSLGCAPAEAAGITIHGNDKWRTLIGNACLAAWGR